MPQHPAVIAVTRVDRAPARSTDARASRRSFSRSGRYVSELIRLAAAFLVAVATLYVVDGVATLLLASLNLPWWVLFLASIVVAVVVGGYVWKRLATLSRGPRQVYQPW